MERSTKRGRPPINLEAMTPAQRQARSRATRLAALELKLARAGQLADYWVACMADGRVAVTDRDIQAGFELLAAEIAGVRLGLPTS